MSRRFTQSRLASYQIVLMSMIAVLTCVATVQAMPLPHWPIDYVVLKSELIVQGHFINEHSLIVDKVFLGDATPGQEIYVTEQISLSRIANDPERECDAIQEKNRFNGKPCRLLKQDPAFVFLQKTAGKWQPTGWGSGVKWLVDGKVLGYSQFSVPGPYVLADDYEARTVEDLYQRIESALQKRGRYEAALAEKQSARRISGLTPFVQATKKDFYWRDAVHSLAATGPASGKALRGLAEKLKGDRARVEVLKAVGEAGDKNSTPYLLTIVAAAKPLIENGAFHWLSASMQQRQTVEEWQVALCAIAQLSDPRALPVLRLSLFDALQLEEFYGSQALVCVERGLENNATPENLVAFGKVYNLYPRWYKWETRTKWASWEALNFLTEHKFREAIPLLAEQLDHPDPGSRSHVRSLLTDIVGRDLGESKGPWLEWFKEHAHTRK